MRIAIVSGSTGVIGQAICSELHANGIYTICGYAHNREKAEALALELESESLELSSNSNIAEAIRLAVERLGRLDILVNASGINIEGNAAMLSIDDWRTVMAVNLDFAFELTQSVLPHMLYGRYGRIVHISSVVAKYGGRGQVNYAASKAALERMSCVFALEAARKGVTVNCVAPGVIISDMTERIRNEHEAELLSHIAAKRFGRPEEVAKAVAFLVGEDAGYINGATLPVDGGMLL